LSTLDTLVRAVRGGTVPAERKRAELAALVLAARNGERAAWDALVDRLARLVWSVTHAFGLDPQDGADVAQIAWMRLAEHIDRLHDPGAVGTWLATTTRNECITVLRQRARVQPTDVDALTEAMTSPAAEATVLTSERDRLVWVAFEQLSERCRRLLRLAVADKQGGYEEISVVLDMPIGSIGPTRQRCLDRLRQLLATAGITSLSDASV
jgi:RNA polymerase sigma factor (sigma-70 family)